VYGATVKDARIMIVDNEEPVVRLLEEILILDGYSNLVIATDPRHVRSLFQAFEPDVLLLDFKMPYLDGFQVMHELEPCVVRGVHVPTVMITADVTPAVRRRAAVSGVDDFLLKPVEMSELLMRVRYLVEARLRKLAAMQPPLLPRSDLGPLGGEQPVDGALEPAPKLGEEARTSLEVGVVFDHGERSRPGPLHQLEVIGQPGQLQVREPGLADVEQRPLAP
jgi:DNA-binding response OmpR family regulator